jgi:hypothetical protein
MYLTFKPLPTPVRYTLYLLIALFLLVALIGVYESDANYVSYRIARNVAQGMGPVYGLAGDPSSDVTIFPVAPLLLAPFAAFVDVAFGGWLAALFALSAGALFMDRLAGGRPAAALAYLAASAVQPSPVMAIMLAFALAALDSARTRRWLLAGVLIALAILTHPLALALAFLIVILAVRMGGPALRLALLTALIAGAGLILTQVATDAGAFVAIVPGLSAVALPALGLGGLIFALRGSIPGTSGQAPVADLTAEPNTDLPAPVAALIAWSAIAALVAALNGAAFTTVILPGAILAALRLPWRWPLLAAIVVDAALGVGTATAYNFVSVDDNPPDVAVGSWIAGQATPDAAVATDRIGAMAYYAGTRVIDLSGALRPTTLDRFFVFRHAPDLVVLHEGLTIPWEGFATTYARFHEADPFQVYIRVVDFAPLDDHGVDVNFSAGLGREDLRLVNVGIGQSLRPGVFVRVRLDWELAHVPAYDVEIKLDLLRDDFTGVGGTLDRLPPEVWRAGRVSTYHGFIVANDAQPGPVSLFVNVGIRAATLGIANVAQVHIVEP